MQLIPQLSFSFQTLRHYQLCIQKISNYEKAHIFRILCIFRCHRMPCFWDSSLHNVNTWARKHVFVLKVILNIWRLRSWTDARLVFGHYYLLVKVFILTSDKDIICLLIFKNRLIERELIFYEFLHLWRNLATEIDVFTYICYIDEKLNYAFLYSHFSRFF